MTHNSAPRAPKVLLIDDEPDICVLLEMLMCKKYDIQATSDSVIGLRLIREQQFDLIITDLKMPLVSGMQIIAEVKKVQPNTPIVVISGHANDDTEIEEARNLGAKIILNKPFRNKEAMATFEKASMGLS